MGYTINPLTIEDCKPVMDIFNYYVENSFAAYPESKLPYQAFDMLLQTSKGYPTRTIKDQNGVIAGFGMLRAYNPMSTFEHTVEVTYFIHPDHTGKGLGKKLLASLEKEGREQGVTNILANISSRNPQSIHFHKKNGFVQCGSFKNVGKKNCQFFDVVWMQKTL